MKTLLHKLTFAVALCSFFTGNELRAQTVSDFENLNLSPGSYWDGSSQQLGASFSSGNALFPNFYDTIFGGYWQSGWAYSNMKDTVDPNFGNLFSAMPGAGYGGSSNYAVGQQGAIVRLTGAAAGRIMDGFYVTNGTYPYFSMKNGDSFAKKFGGTSGNDSDWFTLTVRKYSQGALSTQSVVFYLADYRFSNNAQDYILKTWEWVELSSLGNADSLLLTLNSSDTGSFGMNNPPFFYIDNFSTSNIGVGIHAVHSDEVNSVSVYPNPASDCIFVEAANANTNDLQLTITDINGRQVSSVKFEGAMQLDISGLDNGMYFIHITGTNFFTAQKFIKQ